MKDAHLKNCARCGSEFRGKPRQIYCFECKKSDRNKKQVEKRRNGFANGHLFGKPIDEVIYKRYGKSAAARGIEFYISLEEFKKYWQQPCYYCGAEINTIGLDRYDSDQGYLSGNIVPCCTRCNLSKRNLSGYDFIEMCRRISNNHKV